MILYTPKLNTVKSFFMKQKMLKLMLVFLTISLFSSSRENSTKHCKCLPEGKFLDSESLQISGGGSDDHHLTMLPGNYLFLY
jgi:hypothetical protein